MRASGRSGDDAELARSEEQLRRAILLLWRTNMLRQTRLKVIDEVANALTFYDYTFFRELPRIHGAIEDELARMEPKAARKRIASFLRVGSWIGGDRDGNPFVTAQVLGEAMRLQSARALQHYLEELHELGGELSLSPTLMRVTDELSALAERSTDSSEGAARRALSARDHRHLCAPRQDRARPRSRLGAAAARERRPRLREASRNSAPISPSSRIRWRPTAARSSRAAGCGRCGARSTCSASISRRSICGRIPTSTSARVAELLAAAVPGTKYLELDEEGRIALLLTELRSPRPLVSPFFSYSEETTGELDAVPNGRVDPEAHMARARFAPASFPSARASPTCWSSRCC